MVQQAIRGTGSPRGRHRGIPVPTTVRTQLRQRMQRAGLSVGQAADLLGVTQSTLAALLAGRMHTCSALGYDQWPDQVLRRLGEYEEALALVRAQAMALRQQLASARLPEPYPLRNLLPPTRGRRRSVASVASVASAPDRSDLSAAQPSSDVSRIIQPSATTEEEASDACLV